MAGAGTGIAPWNWFVFAPYVGARRAGSKLLKAWTAQARRERARKGAIARHKKLTLDLVVICDPRQAEPRSFLGFRFFITQADYWSTAVEKPAWMEFWT